MHLRMPSIDRGVQSFLWAVVYFLFLYFGMLAIQISKGTAIVLSLALSFLIFLFVAREAVPLVLGRMNSAPVREVIPVDRMDSLSDEQLRDYLGLSRQQFAGMDRETLRDLMAVREEALDEIPAAFRNDKDATVNTTRWRHLLLPYQWTGYDHPVFIW